MIAKISIQSTFIQANAVNNTTLENPITPIHAFRQKLDFLNEGVIIGIVFFQDKWFLRDKVHKIKTSRHLTGVQFNIY